MMKRCMLALLLGVLCSMMAMAQYNSVKPRKTTIYMFGCALSHTDSLVVITDLQTLDGYLWPSGFLADRSLYSLQLNNYMVGKQNLENMTCVVFFNKKKSKAEKKYQKVRKKYRNHPAFRLQSMSSDAFRFETEEWVSPNVEEMPSPTPTNAQSSAKPTETKKGETKK